MRKNNKSVKKKLPKYAFGGSTHNPLEAYLAIQQKRISENPGVIEDPNTALADNQIRLARAEQTAENNPWTKGLDLFGSLAMKVGSSMMSQGIANGQGADGKGIAGFLNKNQDSVNSGMNLLGMLSQFALGGQVPGVPVEVEGEEVGETPQGDVVQFKGPSHEQGGIDIALPEGTEMFSKRIKVDGVSMADRKKKREKRTMTLEQLLEKNPSDSFIKNSLKRTSEVNDKENNFDLQQQELIAKLLKGKVNPQGPLVNTNDKKLQLGTGQGGLKKGYSKNNVYYENPLLSLLVGQFGQDKNSPSMATPGFVGPKNNPNKSWDADGNGLPDLIQAPNKNLENSVSTTPTKETKTGKGTFNPKDILGSLTTGDALGLIGNYISTFGPGKNTEENRAGDTPNINAFKDFGKDGLHALDKTKQYVNQVRDEQLGDLELSRTAAIKRGRNSARGINTQRALDLSVDANINENKSNIYNQFAQQMMQILGQEAGMENQQDSMVMQGEQARDLADRQDRDNYYTQRGQDIVTKGYGLQKSAKDVNQIKQRDVQQEFMDNFFEYVKANGNTGKISQQEGIKISGDDMDTQLNGFDYSKASNPSTGKNYTKEEWSKLSELQKIMIMGKSKGYI